MKRPVAVIGPGAVGGVLAASLDKAGFPVLLLGRRARQRSLRVFPPGGPARSLTLARTPPRRGDCAAVFLCVKARDFGAALSRAMRLAGPTTPVISLLNGIAHVGPFLSRCGPARAVVGASYIAALRVGPDEVRHMGGRVIALARGPGNAEALAGGRALLRAAGWQVRLAPSAERLLWTKLIFNAAANPLGALSRASNERLAGDPALREILTKAVREGQAAARAAGVRPLHPDLERRVVAACRAAPGQMNSMAQDLALGRPTEAAAILEPVLAAARRGRVKTPLLASLSEMLELLEAKLRRRPTYGPDR